MNRHMLFALLVSLWLVVLLGACAKPKGSVTVLPPGETQSLHAPEQPVSVAMPAARTVERMERVERINDRQALAVYLATLAPGPSVAQTEATAPTCAASRIGSRNLPQQIVDYQALAIYLETVAPGQAVEGAEAAPLGCIVAQAGNHPLPEVIADRQALAEYLATLTP